MTTNSSDLKTGTIEPSTEAATIESVVRSLRRLLEGDPREQRETFEYLKSALEEDCPSSRTLFQ